MADVVYELLAKISVDSSGVQQGMNEAKSQIENSGVPAGVRKAGKVATAAVTAATTAFVAFGKSALSVGMDFDAAMSRVKAISGANGEEFNALREKALYMGRTTKFTSTEAAEALNYMAMAGWKTDQMLTGLEGIMNLAAASGEDLGTTSDIVTDALTAYGLTAEDAAHFADVLAATAANSNTNVGMLGETFKYVAAYAGALGYSVDDTAVAFGLMANSGIKASMAGTALRGLLTRMANPTKQSSAAMEQLGISLSDGEGHMYSFMELMQNMRTAFQERAVLDADEYVAEIQKLDEALETGAINEDMYEEALEGLNERAFSAPEEVMAQLAAELGGQRALAGLLAIVNATQEDFDSLTESIYGASEMFALTEDGSIMPLTTAMAKGLKVVEQYNGATEAMAKIMQDNLSGDVTKLRSAWEGFQLQFSDKFAPEIRRVMPRIIDAVGRLTAKLADMDLSKLADGLASLAEKAIDFIGYLIDHGDQVIAIVEGIMGAVIGGKGLGLLGGIFKTGKETFSWLGGLLGGGKTAGAAAAGAAGKGGLLSWLGGASGLGNTLMATSPLLAILGGGVFGGIQGAQYHNAAVAAGQLGGGKTLAEYAANVQAAQDAYDQAKAGYDSLAESGGDLTMAQLTLDAAKTTLDTAKQEYDATLAEAETAATSTQGTAAETLGGMADDANGWGYDMVTSFANGMNSATVTNLLPAVLGVAGLVSSMLHHSEPDTGPLSDDSTWMPDMMSSFAQGIREGAPEVEGAITDAFDIRSGVGVGLASAGAGVSGRVYNFNVTIDGDIPDPREKAEALLYEMRAILDREEAGLA